MGVITSYCFRRISTNLTFKQNWQKAGDFLAGGTKTCGPRLESLRRSECVSEPIKNMREYLASHPEELKKYLAIARKMREASWVQRHGGQKSQSSKAKAISKRNLANEKRPFTGKKPVKRD